MTRTLLLAAATGLAFATPAFAQEADPTSVDPIAVDEIIVTAARLETPQPLIPGAHVIDQTRIERSGEVFAADLLATVPGVSLYRNGAFGGLASIRLRGAGQDKTLVLVDGVIQNDASQPAGGYDFASLELGDISRIEVLSGPQGSLWGSSAIGGVISLTTRELDGARVELEAGSLDTVRASGAFGVSTADYAFGLSASVFTTDGVSKADEADGNPERDGFDNRTVSAFGRISAGPVILDSRVRWNQSHADIDGFPAPLYSLADTAETYDTETWSGFVRARVSAFGFDHALTLSAMDTERASLGGDFPYSYAADRTALRWQADNEAVTNRLGLAFGLEREDTRAQLSTGQRDDQGVTSAFAVGRYAITDRLTGSLSVRVDAFDDLDPEPTLRATLAYDLAPGVVVTGSWGQGFKAPTISQIYCAFCFAFGPYPELSPERAQGFDLGLSWTRRRGGFSVTAYRIETRDEISFFFDGDTFESYYVNLERSRSTGVEAEARWALTEALDVRVSYAWTDAENAITGARLLRVPEQSGAVDLDWTSGRWRAGLGFRAEGDQADAGGTRDGFLVTRLNGGFSLSDQTEITLRIENLTDARYQESLGYGEAGRTVHAGLRLRY